MIYRSAAGAAAVEHRYLELLRSWPVPNDALTVPTGEGETFVVSSGSPHAPPVVVLQGSGANTAMWLPQIERLARQLRVYAVDVIGEPGLSAPARPPLNSDAYARWLDEVLASLGLGKTALLGVSLGGWLALDYAVRRPERVTKLALLAPSGIGRRKLGVLLAALALRPFGEKGLRQTMRLALGPGGADFPGDAVGAFALLISRHFRPRMEPIPTFSDAALQSLTVPLLAVVGGKDVMVDSYETERRLTATCRTPPCTCCRSRVTYCRTRPKRCFGSCTARPRMLQETVSRKCHAGRGHRGPTADPFSRTVRPDQVP